MQKLLSLCFCIVCVCRLCGFKTTHCVQCFCNLNVKYCIHQKLFTTLTRLQLDSNYRFSLGINAQSREERNVFEFPFIAGNDWEFSGLPGLVKNSIQILKQFSQRQLKPARLCGSTATLGIVVSSTGRNSRENTHR